MYNSQHISSQVVNIISWYQCRSYTSHCGGLLAAHVAGETTHNSHAHQPQGGEQGQVSAILARVWEEAVWTIHSGHYRTADLCWLHHEDSQCHCKRILLQELHVTLYLNYITLCNQLSMLPFMTSCIPLLCVSYSCGFTTLDWRKQEVPQDHSVSLHNMAWSRCAWVCHAHSCIPS